MPSPEQLWTEMDRQVDPVADSGTKQPHRTEVQPSDPPLISVIIPTYNRGNLITTAIESVLDQTEKRFELIVVDDGSDDNTAAVIETINDPRIRYIRREENCGGNNARILGVKLARGKFCAFLDSDDLWHPTKLERQLALFEKAGDPKAVISTDVNMIIDGEIHAGPSVQISDNKTIPEYIFADRGNMVTSTLFLSTDLIREVNFNPDLRINQELDLFMRLEGRGARFRRVHEPLVTFDISDRSDRISNLPHLLEESEAWFVHVSKDWSTRARSGYYINYLFDCAMRGGATDLAWRSYRKGFDPRLGIRMLARKFLILLVGEKGRQAYRWVRRLITARA